MKRLLAVALALCMVLGVVGLTGCKSEKIVDVSKMTPEEHYQYIEGEALSSLAHSITGVYGQVSGAAGGTGNSGTHTDMTVSVGQKGIEMLETMMLGGSGGVDLSFLSNVNISMDVKNKDDLTQVQMAAGLSGTDILTLNMIMNMASGDMFVSIPELSEEFLGVNMGDTGMSANQMNQILGALPSEELIERVLDKYINLVLKNVDGVNRTQEKVELGGLSQQCHVLKVRINEEDALRIVKAVLTEARNDADIKTIIEKMAPVIANDASGSNTYAQFQSAVDEALASLEEETVEDPESYILLTTYTDLKNKVIGRRIALPDNQGEMSYLLITEGKDFAMEAEFGPQASVTGTGTVKNDKYTGTFTVSASGMEALIVETEELYLAESADGVMSGTVRMELGSTIAANAPAYLQGASVEMKINSSKVESEVELKVNLQGETYVTITAASHPIDASGITEPSTSIDVNDQAALQQWLSTIDLQTVMSNLEEAGAGGIVDIIQALVMGQSSVKPAV